MLANVIVLLRPSRAQWAVMAHGQGCLRCACVSVLSAAPKPKRAVVENPPWEQDAAPQQQQQQPGVASLLCQLQPAAERQQQQQEQVGCCEEQKQEQLQLPLSPRQQPHVSMSAAT